MNSHRSLIKPCCRDCLAQNGRVSGFFFFGCGLGVADEGAHISGQMCGTTEAGLKSLLMKGEAVGLL